MALVTRIRELLNPELNPLYVAGLLLHPCNIKIWLPSCNKFKTLERKITVAYEQCSKAYLAQFVCRRINHINIILNVICINKITPTSAVVSDCFSLHNHGVLRHRSLLFCIHSFPYFCFLMSSYAVQWNSTTGWMTVIVQY